jgi:hypothetical protein
VRLGGDQHESGILVNSARGDQNALGPDLAIAALTPEGHALGDQPPAKSLSAAGRVDQQQPQFSDVVGMPDEKYRADLGTVDFPQATMIRLRSRVREERPSWRSSLASERRASGA